MCVHVCILLREPGRTHTHTYIRQVNFHTAQVPDSMHVPFQKMPSALPNVSAAVWYTPQTKRRLQSYRFKWLIYRSARAIKKCVPTMKQAAPIVISQRSSYTYPRCLSSQTCHKLRADLAPRTHDTNVLLHEVRHRLHSNALRRHSLHRGTVRTFAMEHYGGSHVVTVRRWVDPKQPLDSSSH